MSKPPSVHIVNYFVRQFLISAEEPPLPFPDFEMATDIRDAFEVAYRQAAAEENPHVWSGVCRRVDHKDAVVVAYFLKEDADVFIAPRNGRYWRENRIDNARPTMTADELEPFVTSAIGWLRAREFRGEQRQIG